MISYSSTKLSYPIHHSRLQSKPYPPQRHILYSSYMAVTPTPHPPWACLVQAELNMQLSERFCCMYCTWSGTLLSPLSAITLIILEDTAVVAYRWLLLILITGPCPHTQKKHNKLSLNEKEKILTILWLIAKQNEALPLSFLTKAREKKNDQKDQIYFCKIRRNQYYKTNLLPRRLHWNGINTIGFCSKL